MTVAFDIFQDINLVAVRYRGTVSVEDDMAVLARIYADDRYHPRLNFFFDTRDAQFTGFTLEGMIRAMSALRPPATEMANPYKLAVYAPGDMGFGLGRMYQTLAEMEGHKGVGVFRDRADALAHLDLTEGQVNRYLKVA